MSIKNIALKKMIKGKRQAKEVSYINEVTEND